MNKLLVFFILTTCCAFCVSGFLSEKKHGCDAKPCKYEATCNQDRHDKDKYTCTCKGEYHGIHCENKNACHSKPCKKGTCTNDKKDPKKFHCSCDSTHVGERCDIENKCLGSHNPCKSGSKCTLDAKHKPVCSCPAGYSGTKCDKKNCTIHEYKFKHADKHSAKLFVDKSIDAKLKEIDDMAKKCKVKIHVLSSFILHSKKEMKHDTRDRNAAGQYIGEAFTCHIYDENNKLLCNDICLRKSPIPMKDARCFIDEVTKKGWKWGIDNPTLLYTNHPAYYTPAYIHRREEVQVGCSDGKW